MTASLHLRGRRILVTRAREQAGQLMEVLRARGARPALCPTIETVPPEDLGPLDAALAALDEYDWVVFSSANAVRFTGAALARLGWSSRRLGHTRVAAIGPATAAAVRALGLPVHLQPEEYVAEALLAAFSEVAGLRFLLPRAAAARHVLPLGLEAAGARVDVVTAYVTRPPAGAAAALVRVFEEGSVDAALFTSASTVRNFATLLGGPAHAGELLGTALTAFLGPVAADAARALGMRVDIVAETYTVEGLVAALESAWERGTPG